MNGTRINIDIPPCMSVDLSDQKSAIGYGKLLLSCFRFLEAEGDEFSLRHNADRIERHISEYDVESRITLAGIYDFLHFIVRSKRDEGFAETVCRDAYLDYMKGDRSADDGYVYRCIAVMVQRGSDFFRGEPLKRACSLFSKWLRAIGKSAVSRTWIRRADALCAEDLSLYPGNGNAMKDELCKSVAEYIEAGVPDDLHTSEALLDFVRNNAMHLEEAERYELKLLESLTVSSSADEYSRRAYSLDAELLRRYS